MLIKTFFQELFVYKWFFTDNNKKKVIQKLLDDRIENRVLKSSSVYRLL